MTENHKALLSRVFAEVLEQMAFMFADAADADEPPPPPESPLLAHMTFRGAMSGKLSLAVAADMCPEIAANLLGTEPEEGADPKISRDALKELLNVTCGHVLTALAGDEPVFDLTVPQVEELSEEAWTVMATAAETAALLVDDRPVLLSIDLAGKGA